MAIQIKHPFVSLKGDGTDATQVQPSNWNANHSFTLATQKLVGRLTAGTGAAEEISLSTYMAGLLGSADAATLAGVLGLFETGDVKYTFKTTAAAGWLLVAAAGSIGDATSSATLRANADTFALFDLIYTACSDAIAPVSGGRGANSTADFNAHKRLTIPQLVGKSPMGAGAAGTGTSARTLGTGYGEETHALTTGELASHAHAVFLNDPGHTHSIPVYLVSGLSFNYASGGSQGGQASSGYVTGSNTTGITVRSASGGGGTANITDVAGSGTAHNTIHPVVALNAMVKL